jgi:hypothetical protein
MTMELDEMKLVWARMEQRQDAMDARLRRDFRDRKLDKARSSMRSSLLMQMIEIAAWVLFVVWVASFWVQHRHATHLLVIGLLLHGYGIAAIWSAATQLFLLSRIHLFDAPVLVLQQRLAQLRRFRFCSQLLLGLPWWFLWLPVTTVGMVWLWGVDLYTVAAPGWYWATMGVGVIGMGACLWLARRLAGRSIKSPTLRRLVDDMSGRSLLRASQQLDALAGFERE